MFVHLRFVSIACALIGMFVGVACTSPSRQSPSLKYPNAQLVRLGEIGFANSSPVSLASDGQGNVYVADSYKNRVLKIGTDGKTTVLAGSGGEELV